MASRSAKTIRGGGGGRGSEDEAASGRKPGLAVGAGGRGPGERGVRALKGKACEEAGMHSVTIRLPAETSEAELLGDGGPLNADPAIHGILVQMPLPKQINSEKVLQRIDPREGRGRLSSGERRQAA